jgi:hypothetical protein
LLRVNGFDETSVGQEAFQALAGILGMPRSHLGEREVYRRFYASIGGHKEQSVVLALAVAVSFGDFLHCLACHCSISVFVNVPVMDRYVPGLMGMDRRLQLRDELTEAIDTVIGSAAAIEQLVNLGLLGAEQVIEFSFVCDEVSRRWFKGFRFKRFESAVRAEPRVLGFAACNEQLFALTVVMAAAASGATETIAAFAIT